MSQFSELKSKADELLDGEFIWYMSPVDPDGLAVGIDWETQAIVIVDMDHPDGAVIQTGGLLDINTIYVKEGSDV
jgi:hypothetical protein